MIVQDGAPRIQLTEHDSDSMCKPNVHDRMTDKETIKLLQEIDERTNQSLS